MLGLINNLRFDRLEKSKKHSFKTNLENYNISELLPYDYARVDNKHLSLDWISIFKKQ